MGLAVLVLAAGKGTRMKSRRTKVLHEICGRPMLAYPLAVAAQLGAERLVVVIGRDADQVEAAFAGRAQFVVQAEQRGTGHAVEVALERLGDFSGDVLILYGDTPLLRAESRAPRT
jgi:bifunctional UDP-N-acetylglucosamine pyrophosphorylase/glucosamine-1-phosphate N-acetyltransferase